MLADTVDLPALQPITLGFIMKLSIRRATWPALVLLLLLTPRGDAPRADPTATLSGTVLDARGKPIADARVTLSGESFRARQVTTDANGAYRFPALSGGMLYTLSVECDGYRSLDMDGFGLETERSRHLDLRLRRPGEREVAIIASHDPFPYDSFLEVLRQQLDVPFVLHELDRDDDPEATVRRVRAERPNLIITTGLTAARLVRREIRQIPAILTLINDPRRHDLKAANICFVANNPDADHLIGRIADILPGAERIGLIFDAQSSYLLARDIRKSARRRSIKVALRPCYRLKDLDKVLESLLGEVDALVVPYDTLMAGPRVAQRITAWALRHRVPLAAPGSDWVRHGALFSYGASPETIAFDVAWVASRILFHGQQPGDFELRLPTNRVLTLNEGTAFALGIDIPPELEFDRTY